MKPTFSSVKAKVKVVVKDAKGNVITIREKESDLVVKHVDRVLRSLLARHVSRISQVFGASPVEEEGGGQGTNANYIEHWSDVSWGFNDYSAYADLTKVKIAVGTGTISPTRDDYALEAKVAEAAAESASITVGAEDALNVKYVVAILFTVATTIRETGLFFEYQGYGGYWWFMVARDVLPTPVDVPVNASISVTYELTI